MSSTGHSVTREPIRTPRRATGTRPAPTGRVPLVAVLAVAVVLLCTLVADVPVARDVAGRLRCAAVGGAAGGGAGEGAGTAVMTPYAGDGLDDGFVRGATLEVPPEDRRPGVLAERLRLMRDRFRIGTVSVYGLEGWDAGGGTAEKDALWAALAALDLQVIVRLEAYDPGSFAFRDEDAGRLVEQYEALLRYAAAPGRRDTVTYLALTMPVDDPVVQARLGGPAGEGFTGPQPAYARAAVAGVRRVLAGQHARIPVYLGVFYGWDNTYPVPSYASSGADGYFLNSYSYPQGDVPGDRAPDHVLINESRLRSTMERFVSQYGPEAPVVVEYGFHTRARHGGAVPAQTAGLVQDRAAKRRALVATTRFYCSQFPGVRGTVYFGFNIRKEEGYPPALLDFGLVDDDEPAP